MRCATQGLYFYENLDDKLDHLIERKGSLRMPKIRFFFVFTLLASLLVAGRFVWADPAPQAANTQAEPPSTPLNSSPASALPWQQPQDPSAESRLGWALWDVTQKTGDVAKAVRNSVTSSIGDYVKEKQKEGRRGEQLHRFYTNLEYVIVGLRLAPPDQNALAERIKQIYIEDAESGRRQLDALHFSQLPYVARKEYAEMLRARTRDGEVDTFYLNGALKTHWVLKNGRPEGAIVTNDENGEIRYIDLYKEGRKIRRSKYDSEGRLVFQQNYDYDLTADEPAPL